jgi:hypothetical protein
MNKFKYLGLLVVLIWSAVALHAQDSSADVAITLERTACFGTCPIYTVTILEDGTVNYVGADFVEVTGEQTSQIDPQLVEQMVAEFEAAGYFDWDAAYDAQTVTDMPTIITSVTRDGETHQVTRYAGDGNAPIALPFLELWVDIVANTGLWTGVQPDVSAITHGGNTPLVTLQQEPCFGFCPVFNVALFEDGTVVFMGIANVDDIGVTVQETDALSVTSIAQLAQAFGYFNWNDAYQEQFMTDQITVITSVRWEDNYKRIIRYDGDMNAPVGLVRVENMIKELVSPLIGAE